MAKTSTMKPIPVQQMQPPTTSATAIAKPAKTAKPKQNAMAALFGQKRQKSAVVSVPTKTPAF